MRAICILALFIFWNFICFCQTNFKWNQQLIKLEKGVSFHLKVPEGYSIKAAAEGLNRPRFFAKSPDGRLFVTDMYNRGDNKNGKILILENWSDEKKRFLKVTTFLNKLHNPNSIAFHTANNKNFIYIAETGKLSFYEYKAGDSVANGVPTVIATFPDYGLSYKYGGWHLTRSIAFHNNKIYASVGSSCDACIEKEEVRATILEMDPDGSNKKIFARGIRNGVGLKWVKDQLWVTHMGRDNRGPDKPEELFHTVNRGGFYGWPYYYQFKKAVIADTQFIRKTGLC